jgi:hypothetical protein
MDSFVTVENMKTCEVIFARYMHDKFNLPVSMGDGKVRRILWRIMQDVKQRPPPPQSPTGQLTLRQLNDVTLNIARDVFLKGGQQQQQQQQQKQQQKQQDHQQQRKRYDGKKPQVGDGALPPGYRPATIQPLMREQALFGDRPLPLMAIQPPQNSEPKRIDSSKLTQTFERMVNEREQEVAGSSRVPAAVAGLESLKVDKLDSTEMARLMGDMEKHRGYGQPPPQPSPPPQEVLLPQEQHQQQRAKLEQATAFDTYYNDVIESRERSSNNNDGDDRMSLMAVSEFDQNSSSSSYTNTHTFNSGANNNHKTFNVIDVTELGSPPPPAPSLLPSASEDAAAIFRQQMAERDRAMEEERARLVDSRTPIISRALLDRQSGLDAAAVQAPPSHVRSVERYISVNSFDRDWLIDPFRYSYNVAFSGYADNSAQRLFKNVRSLSITRVVLPLEIDTRPTLSVITAKTSASAYVNDYSFSFPYITVRIEGFDDVYDGTNESVRRAFCAMVFDKAFRAPNGRGYVILQPMQQEKKVFHPAPLSSLRSFKLSLVKPNGAIINNSTDDYMISKIEYEDYNPTQLRIVLDKFFDKNDFYVGDIIKFQGYRAYGTPDDGSFHAMSAFVNRTEGHEVTELGQPNENGYYKTFYIQAPGYLDKAAGRLMIDQPLITGLLNFNAMQQSITDPALYSKITNGGVCNTSLQNTISFTVMHDVADSPHIDNERFPPM